MDTELFVEFGMVAKHGNLSEAAKELNLTQSALSRHLNSLEQYAGTPLFDRSTNPMRITRAGELFLERSSIITGEVTKLESLMKSVRYKEFHNFNVCGLMTAPIATALRASKRRFEGEWPLNVVKFTQTQYQTPFEMLREESMHVAVEPISSMIDTHGLQSQHLLYENTYIVVENDNPLATRDHLFIHDTDSIRFTSPRTNRDHAARKHLQTLCLSNSTHCGIPKTITISNVETLDELFLCGTDGQAIMLPESLAKRYAGSGTSYTAIPFEDESAAYDFHLFYAENPTPEVARFVEIALEEASLSGSAE